MTAAPDPEPGPERPRRLSLAGPPFDLQLQAWLHGTHRDVSREHLQVHLDEFVFRHNRRRTAMAAFQTLLGLAADGPPTTYRQITTHAA
jgi:hypothetical protein